LYLPHDGDRDAPAVRRRAVLPQVDALPGPQVATAVCNRNRQRRLRQDRADMRRHVVRTLVGVVEDRITVGDQPGEVTLQVAADVKRSVLTDDYRGTRMVDKDRAESARHR